MRNAEGNLGKNHFNMVAYVREGWTAKIIALFGFVLQLIIVAIPKDFIRWLCLRRKIVKGKCIVITGGASGIGHRMAELFADPNGLGAQELCMEPESMKW
uniref:Epimerase domain-containing protein n=1 Tax=Globodera pallida TaxID=36090 RepID=A0A183CIW6_GLOPA